MTENRETFDNPWKDALEKYFPEFMGFFFPDAYARIDWQKDYDRPVASLVILADANPNWRPHHFGYQLFDCRVGIEFPTVKLLDYNEELESLRQADNAFAIVTAAHLLTLRTREDNRSRYDAKWRLTRMLYERGWSRERVANLFGILDWLMTLPPELENSLIDRIIQFEEERNMPFVSPLQRLAEKRGMEKGMEKGRSEEAARLLRRQMVHRFGSLPEWAEKRISSASVAKLENWAETILEAETLEGVFEEKS